MTARVPNPMPREMRGRLGGLQAAHNLGPEGIKARGSKGGDATVAKYGKVHMTRLALKKSGRIKEVTTSVKAS